ncbi:MAG: flagellar motor protein MotB [Myxococcales bacterium FL481]|nr:MAG: flagellar motor protein MotB [Myxococcales bacterium FL481]
MSAEGEERPIIIVKKKGHGGHGHHGGSWKVAIADLMTAMMALFMVLWLIGQSPKTRSSVGAYFRDPMGLAGGGNTENSTGPHSGGASFHSGGNTAINPEMGFTAGRVDLETGMAKLGRPDLLELSRARERLAQALMALRMDTWSRHVELTSVDEGLRIEVQDDFQDSLFVSGSTKINPKAESVLIAIAEELGALPNRVVIEGHTDAAPTGKRSRVSNWEISTQRANSARRFLLAHGLRRDQVSEVRGYASQRLRLWHEPDNPRNRRISVLVLLERGAKKVGHGDPKQAHPLLERLQNLDYRNQSLGNELELAPGGTVLPAVPPDGGSIAGPTPAVPGEAGPDDSK